MPLGVGLRRDQCPGRQVDPEPRRERQLRQQRHEKAPRSRPDIDDPQRSVTEPVIRDDLKDRVDHRLAVRPWLQGRLVEPELAPVEGAFPDDPADWHALDALLDSRFDGPLAGRVEWRLRASDHRLRRNARYLGNQPPRLPAGIRDTGIAKPPLDAPHRLAERRARRALRGRLTQTRHGRCPRCSFQRAGSPGPR